MDNQNRQDVAMHRRANILTVNSFLHGIFASFILSITIGILVFTIQIGAEPQQTPDIKQAQQIPQSTEQQTSSIDQSAEPIPVSQLWTEFYAARDSAEAARDRRDIAAVTAALLRASRAALSLNRKDLAAWQLNNIGYYSIEEFKKRTDYTFRLNNIEKMRRGPEKVVYLKETKRIFRDNLYLLTEATKHLEEAYEMDKDMNDDERTQKIYSNLAFIDWVRNFANSK
jgi:hypothetical protein